jgi:hypothetical protein
MLSSLVRSLSCQKLSASSLLLLNSRKLLPLLLALLPLLLAPLLLLLLHPANLSGDDQ